MSRRLPKFLAEDEPERLILAAQGYRNAERDRVICMVGLYQGLRVAETCKLKVEDIDWRRTMLWVREGKGCKDRMLPISNALRGPLRAYLMGRRHGPVFPSRVKGNGHMTTRAVQKIVLKLAKLAGIKCGAREVTYHKFRHAFATRLLDAGVPIHNVRDLLGHSSLAVTDHYAHCSPARLRESINLPYEAA